MTTRYTDEEWISIIAKTEEQVKVNDQPYHCPIIGSVDFAKTIDHTLLKLDATPAQIDSLCAEARVADFATVCVRQNYVHQAAANLKGTTVKIACVIGFHEGTQDLYSKVHETHLALAASAHELDIVLNRTLLHPSSYSTLYSELATLRAAAPPPILLKLILETSQLSASEILAACTIAHHAQFDFVKTSTGFCGHGARAEDVRLMKAACEVLGRKEGRCMAVKASGVVRTLDEAVSMLEAGAGRLGTSGGVGIVREGKERVGRKGGVGGGGEGDDGERLGAHTDY